jgi:hypothetical protein
MISSIIQPVTAARDFEQLGAMQEPIQNGRRAGHITNRRASVESLR